jgi:hypothetical protein
MTTMLVLSVAEKYEGGVVSDDMFVQSFMNICPLACKKTEYGYMDMTMVVPYACLSL